MTTQKNAYKGLYTAGNNHYHGVKSIAEFGAIAHANSLAKVLIQGGKVATEEEALSLANFEVQRLKWNDDGFQGNRIARDKLRSDKAVRDEQQRNQKKEPDKLRSQGL
ncbi:hypothetical protein [Comamonas composti]|uniref:hypothetical protein n=1 Tax=Comamonas composti TaxID=408558 RepID=UPI0004187CB8|nr:hypothetical protein [Comamonas composti]